MKQDYNPSKTTIKLKKVFKLNYYYITKFERLKLFENTILAD